MVAWSSLLTSYSLLYVPLIERVSIASCEFLCRYISPSASPGEIDMPRIIIFFERLSFMFVVDPRYSFRILYNRISRIFTE